MPAFMLDPRRFEDPAVPLAEICRSGAADIYRHVADPPSRSVKHFIPFFPSVIRRGFR